jgi:hypothetical protein
MAEEDVNIGDIALSNEEMQELSKLVNTANIQEEKSNIHNFLLKVVQTNDTTKVANLTEEELGVAKFPVRTLQELSLFSDEIGNMPYFSSYFKKEGEIILATSLSRDAKLLDSAITTSKQVGGIPTKTRKKNKGWFGFGGKKND